MNPTLTGLIGIAVGVFLGLLGIALAIGFGLRSFRKDVLSDLSPIKEKVIVIQGTVQNVWDVVRRSPIFGTSGTVIRSLKNLGEVKITAEPLTDETIYFIEAQAAVTLDSRRIISLSEDTGLNNKEKQLFGKLVHVSDLLPHQIKMEVPSTDSKLCAEYLSFFLKWLNTKYYQGLPNAKHFEEPILRGDNA